MNIFLVLAYLFFIGSTIGFGIEVIYRRFFSKENTERKWIKPGFCVGPYLPIYGVGLCVMFLLACLEKLDVISNPVLNKLLLFTAMALGMTLIEYIAGLCLLKFSNLRLWDYRNEWGNLQGIICPKFSFYWAILGAIYYFLIHPYIINALVWLSNNLAFSFFIGLFFGLFIIDVIHSANLVSKIKALANENEVIVRYEALKANIRKRIDENKEKYHFFKPFKSDKTLFEHIKEMKENFEEKKKKK